MYIQQRDFLALVREAKRRGKTVVVGGPYPTSLPEESLAAGADYVVRGEAENTIPLLLEAMRDGKTGVIERFEKPDMTTSPIPRFDLLPKNDYNSMGVQTSRGCPFDCEFCDVVSLFGRKTRHKAPKQVIAELDALHRLGLSRHVFICDDNFIGSRKHALDLLHELISWSKSHGEPFTFITQASVNLGQDLEIIDLMTEGNVGSVFIGIESPDENVLLATGKHHNVNNPLVESVNNIKNNGMWVMGSFIVGFDKEVKGAGERICAFVEQTDIPVAFVGILQAPPGAALWSRLESEGRLRQDLGSSHDGGTYSAPNFDPERPEKEIVQEFVDVWEYLYEPSRYLARTYRYFRAMRPTRAAIAAARGELPPGDDAPAQGVSMRARLIMLLAFFKILWRQGIRPPFRGQFWRQLFGMLRWNPSRVRWYIDTCSMGEDLFEIRKNIRAKMAPIREELDRTGSNQTISRPLTASRS
jgi:radical SAM superfamily enzyme YgiQ (UPF0313 family)